MPRGARTASSVASTVPIRLWTTHRPSCGSHFLDLLSCKWTIHGPTIPSSIMRPYEQGTSSHTRAQLLLLYEITKNVKSRKKTVQDYRAGGQPAGARTNCCYDMTGRRRCLPSNGSKTGRAWKGVARAALAPSRADLHVPIIQPCIFSSFGLFTGLLRFLPLPS